MGPHSGRRTIRRINATSIGAVYAAQRAGQLVDYYDDADELLSPGFIEPLAPT